MKAKKAVWTTGVVVASLLIAYLLLRGILFGVFSHTNTWKWVAEYEDYASEFNTVKDYVLENYASEEERVLDVTTLLNEHGRTLYDRDTEEYAELPEPIQAALDAVDENAFPDKDSDLDKICVRGGRVDFCISSGTYRLVYSPDEKPTWFRSSDDETKIRVKRIKDGWYHVVKK